MFLFPQALPPFDRPETNGFRLVEYGSDESFPASFSATVALPTRDFRLEEPVSDEVFDVYRDLYSFDPIPLEAETESAEEFERWSQETVTFNAAYGGERVTAFLLVPHDVQPPYQPILYFPGAGAVVRGASGSPNIEPIRFLMTSGRAELYPIYKGTYERNAGQSTPWPEDTRAYRDWMVQIGQDARRSVDYLESRPDIDVSHLGYYGTSWGSMLGPVVVALDPRFKAAVFHIGGLAQTPAPPEADPFNFAPRVTIPVLMTNGDNDFIF